MERWVLSKSSFDQFLESLDPDVNRAGQKYEALRLRTIKFFEWRACSSADDLADEVIDRVIRKISAGEKVTNHAAYTYGVAKLLYLENSRRIGKEQALENEERIVAPEHDNDDPRLSSLETCLGRLPEETRRMVLQYYHEDKQAKIDHRKSLADSLGVSANALRIKTNRIRAKLEECVSKTLRAQGLK